MKENKKTNKYKMSIKAARLNLLSSATLVPDSYYDKDR